MEQEIINYPFDQDFDNETERSDSSEPSIEEGFIDRTAASNSNISYVNGHNLPDDEEEEDEEDDLVLGDEDELEEADLAEDEIDVEVDEDVDAVVSDDDLVLDADADLDDDEDDDDL